MPDRLRTALKETAAYLFMALKALYFWRREPPVTEVSELVTYVETRSKFVAQTTLFSYIKARVGTRYVAMYEDPLFTESVNIAKWEIYLASLCDFAIYAVASIGRRCAARPGELAALAAHIVDSAILTEEIPAERPQGFGDISETFARRIHATAWNQIEPDADLFRDSLSALVEWAPIADELKAYDVEIVKNSMRFKWKKVRDQFDQLLDAEAVLADWRSTNGESPESETD